MHSISSTPHVHALAAFQAQRKHAFTPWLPSLRGRATTGQQSVCQALPAPSTVGAS